MMKEICVMRHSPGRLMIFREINGIEQSFIVKDEEEGNIWSWNDDEWIAFARKQKINKIINRKNNI